jgi:zona occludens toxin (predicted ATPase)
MMMNKLFFYALFALMLTSTVFAQDSPASDAPSDAPSDSPSDMASTMGGSEGGEEGGVGTRAVSASSLPLSAGVCTAMLGAIGAGSAFLLV